MTYDGVSEGQTSVALKASVTYALGESGTVTLYVSDPSYAQSQSDGCKWPIDSQQYGGDLSLGGIASVSGNVDLTTRTYPKSCSAAYAGQPPVNGTWTATLGGSADATPATRTFAVRIAPAAPTGLSGTSPGPLQETIGWVRNPELDTHLYEVLDGAGNSLGSYPADQACNSMTCSATVSVGNGGSQSFQVEAFRRSAPTSDVNDPSTAGDLTATSAAAAFTVQAGTGAGASSPTTAAGGSGPGAPDSGAPDSGASGSAATGSSETGSAQTGSTGDGSGGGLSGSTVSGSTPSTEAKAGDRATAKSSTRSGAAAAPVAPKAPKKGAPVLGHILAKGQAAKLSAIFESFGPPVGSNVPPLPVLAGAAPAAPAGASPADDDPGNTEPTDQGTFKRNLGYTPQSMTTSVTTTSVPLSSVADAIGVSPVGLWRSVACSLLLLLGAAHVRRFAKAPID